MIIAAIVVTDLNNAIGNNNKLLCHLPADLKFFKSVTMGHPIVMGRKTYESIGRVLPGRKNIVITRSSDYRIEGADIYHDIEKALAESGNDKVFIIGGSEIFTQAWPFISEIYRTAVDASFEADTWFPDLKNGDFELSWQECHKADEKNHYDYCFEKWERKMR